MLGFIRKRKRSVAVAVFSVVLISSLLINKHINDSFENEIYSEIDTIPHNHVALLLGTAKTFQGRMNLYFTTRINATAKLYSAGKVDKIIASGDNSRKNYDEPSDMKEALIKAGVKADDIYLDYAGFRTLDSVVRLKKVFNIHQVTIISQKSHCQRALFIAKEHGLKAIAFTASDVIYPGKIKLQIREYLARVKAWLDVMILNKKPKYLGKPVKVA